VSFTYVNITPWLRDLATITPGAEPKVRKRMFLLACREFFEQSAVWRLVIGPEDTVADQAEYTPASYLEALDGTNAYVSTIHAVQYKSLPLRVLPRRPRGEESESESVFNYYLPVPTKVALWGTPTTAEEDALTFFVSLAPKMTSNYLPDFAETHLYDALFDGAAGRLMGQPAKAYSDPLRATYHMNRFRAAIGKYAAQGKAGFSGAPSWAFPRFGK
jgi:hypothetical protein